MTRFHRAVLTIAALAGAAVMPASPVAQSRPPVGDPAVIAIRGGTVLTVANGSIPDGVVLVRGGRIAAVGADVAIPGDATVVDATGRFVSPGLIDAHSHIAADSINEGGTAVSSMTGIEDVFDPTDIDIHRDLAGGLTTANIMHGSANPIGGKSLVIKLRWGGESTEAFTFAGALPGIKFALGENPKDMRPFGQGGPRRYPVSRLGVEFVIRDAFTRAKAYQREWASYAAAKAKGGNLLPPRRDLQLEPLVEVLEGRRLVHAHCYRADEILMLLRLAEELGFRIATLQHVLEGYKVAKEIAAHGAGASTFSDWWGYKIEAIDATPWNAALMFRRGVLVSVNSDSAEHARRLNTEAAKSIKWGGLSDDEALALVTINPARQLRIDARVGSLEPGKDADIVVWNRHPLSSYAVPDLVFVDGTLYYDRGEEDSRVEARARRKRALLESEKGKQKTPEPRGTRQTTDDPAPAARRARSGVGGSRGGKPAPARAVRVAHQSAGSGGPVDLAIVNARIHPVTSGTIERGTVLIRGGLIAAVGPDVATPPEATVVDARGGDVYPGWIDASSALGLAEPGPRGFQDTTETLDFNPHLRTRVAFHPDNEGIPVARSNGVTTVAVTPTGGVLGGEVAVMQLDGWTWEESVLAPRIGISFQFPSLTPSRGRGRESQRERSHEDLKKERDRRLGQVAELLGRARAYARMAPPERPRDWVLEALVPVVERTLPLVVSANREADIREAVAFADRERVRIILRGGMESPRVAESLAEKDIPVILGPVLTLPLREDDHHAATYRAPAALAEAGVRFAFTGGSDATNVRLLPYQASQAVAWGLPRDRAIRALTIDAASILGVAERVGSLEPGKIANLFVARGDPLEMRTQIVEVVIGGRRVGVENRHKMLYERYAKRP